MTAFYLDTEYNGFRGTLISLALVSSEGLGWYAAKIITEPYTHWVAENVIPVLQAEPIRPLLFKSSFQEFIKQFQNPRIICDWHEDAIHFCSLLAGHDYGSSLDFGCELVILKTPPQAYQSKIPHNAFADAEALMLWHTTQK